MLVTPAGSLFSSTGPGSYFTLNTGGNSNKYYVWYSVSGGSNTDPTPVGLTGIQVTVLSGDTAAQVAVKTNAALAALAAATTSVSGSTVTVVPTAVTAQAATPTFSPAAGTFGVTQSVAISSATAGASIYYTTDGSTPTIASTLYSTSVSVAVSETLKAIAVKSGFANSAIGTSVYVIGGTQVATPTFFPVAGTYSGTQNVAVSSLTSGAAFYYTVDGTTPTTGSTLYTGPIVVNASETVKVLATHSGLTNSAIATAVYSITALGPAALNLGTSTNPQAASYYRILSESGISTTAGSAITGNIGVTPIAATAITGFGLVGTDADTSYTSTLVSGLVFAASNASPTSANLGDALGVANAAYTDAAGRTGQTGTNLGSAGEIGGLTLQPGLYKWTTAVTISSTLTLNGGVNDVFIAQISGSLGLANGIHVVLTGGMKASNVFWQTSGAVTLGTTSIFNGILLSATNIAVQTGATVHGALYAQTAVTLDDNAVSA